MHHTHILLSGLLMIPAFASAADISNSMLRSAVQKGLSLLEKTNSTFIQKGGCNSCHNQMLPAAAQAYAKERGIATGPAIVQLPPEVNEFTTERIIEGNSFGANSMGYELFSYAFTKRPADARILSQVYLLKSLQQPEGQWRTAGNRPPLTIDDFTTTAYAIHALKTYAADTDRADHETRIARARSWLLEAKPQTAQERAFHLLGLAWSKAGREALDKAARGLETAQGKDHGWSQLAALPSDAFATGIALFALHEAGMPASHATYQSGLRYLINTQAADGTWHVKTRSLPVQPYFESGYPYEHDQWISAAAAAYATLAIAAAVEPQQTAQR
jgi:hypothetical protein